MQVGMASIRPRELGLRKIEDEDGLRGAVWAIQEFAGLLGRRAGLWDGSEGTEWTRGWEMWFCEGCGHLRPRRANGEGGGDGGTRIHHGWCLAGTSEEVGEGRQGRPTPGGRGGGRVG